MTTNHPSDVLCPLPRRIERVRVSITSPLVQPSPNGRRVGIRIVTFEACSGFTRVTARRIAQPPKATFVTRLQPSQLPGQAARQLPDQSTTLRVESSSTDDSRLRGALPTGDICSAAKLPYSISLVNAGLCQLACRLPRGSFENFRTGIRNKAVAVGHFHARQGLRVEHGGFVDDLSFAEDVGAHGVDIVC